MSQAIIAWRYKKTRPDIDVRARDSSLIRCRKILHSRWVMIKGRGRHQSRWLIRVMTSLPGGERRLFTWWPVRHGCPHHLFPSGFRSRSVTSTPEHHLPRSSKIFHNYHPLIFQSNQIIICYLVKNETLNLKARASNSYLIENIIS